MVPSQIDAIVASHSAVRFLNTGVEEPRSGARDCLGQEISLTALAARHLEGEKTHDARFAALDRPGGLSYSIKQLRSFAINDITSTGS